MARAGAPRPCGRRRCRRWLFAKLTVGAFVPRRWHPFFRLVGAVMVGASALTCLRHGQPAAAALGVCMLADLVLACLGRHRARAAVRLRTVPSLARA